MFKEKVFRKLNARVQKSNSSDEMKLMLENGVLAVDIVERLSAITTEKSASIVELQMINANLRDILQTLREE